MTNQTLAHPSLRPKPYYSTQVFSATIHAPSIPHPTSKLDTIDMRNNMDVYEDQLYLLEQNYEDFIDLNSETDVDQGANGNDDEDVF